MIDLLVAGGIVLTQNPDREVVEGGAVAVDDGAVVGVGDESELRDRYGAAEVVDAAGSAVLPGLINAHTHVADVLLRGYAADRSLYDWLYNVRIPGVAAMDAEAHGVAAALYCEEAVRAGVTTFVENDLECGEHAPETVAAKMDAYETAGIRVRYARGLKDDPPGGAFRRRVERLRRTEPDVDHPPVDAGTVSTERGIGIVEDIADAHHGRGDGRIEVWIAPAVPGAVTREGFERALAFARRHDVMTTTHAAEVDGETADGDSVIEYLDDIGYLSERTLLGHCVHVTRRDVRRLAATGTRVAHNPVTNLRLGAGVAPVPEMRDKGVPLGLGTDNPSLNDRVDPLADLRVAATVHAGHRRDPGVVPARVALDAATIGGARAVGRAEDLGSLEPGKRADVVVVDLDAPALTPHPDPVTTLVHAAGGTDVSTVICDGEVVFDASGSRIRDAYPDLLDRARTASRRIARRAGLTGDDRPGPDPD